MGIYTTTQLWYRNFARPMWDQELLNPLWLGTVNSRIGTTLIDSELSLLHALLEGA